MSASLHVLVVGATGRTGMKIVSKLYNTGHTVHALVRNREKARQLLSPDIHLIEHDLLKYSEYDSIVQNIDIVVYAAGATSSWFGKSKPKDIDYQSVRQMAMAADNHQVKQFILISSMGVTHPFFFINLYGRVLSWKLKGEDALRDTQLNYAIIRPGRLVDEGFAIDKCVLYQDDKVHNQLISREEVAEVVEQCVANPELVRVTFEVARDEKAVPEPLSAKFLRLIPDQDRTRYSNVKIPS